ncbi:DUF1684 domain-containing protein [Bacteroidota bacterium]
MIYYKKILLTTLLLSIIYFTSCDTDSVYIENITKDRIEKDSLMQFDDNSPFNFKGKIEFQPLKYFDVDPEFKFESKLVEYEVKDTLTIYGTQGEARETIRFGYLTFPYDGSDYRVNVYQNQLKNKQKYYSIWFTDKTTNIETYGVGRYLEFEKKDDPEYAYEIDFNLAFNPYCAYNKVFSCAIPTQEDYINLAITAGEKKIHD